MKSSNRKRKGLGLGIDAGGTYTDSVIYDFTHNRVIAWSKALTTHDNYAIGIEDSLNYLLKQVPESISSKIGLVSLSTTMATNAIVEGKGGRVGLILIGYDKYSVRKIDFQPKFVIEGKHNINGEEIEPLDVAGAKKAIKSLLAKGIEAFAVSSEIGVRNPDFEKRVKELILKTAQLPVVCGSELTRELNCVKRANSCFFNARLIPMVSDLLFSVKKVLKNRMIDAPIMIVKGDGALMSEEVAKTNPVEMILSGPAASSIGGLWLSKIKNGYVVDMGGTTTDVAIIKNGVVNYKEDGIRINGFRTAVKTVNVHTFGLGGDSYIQYDIKKRRITIGPRRVMPLCYLASNYLKVLAVLKEKGNVLGGEEILVQPADFFIFQKDFNGPGLHPQEEAIIHTLKEHGPQSRTRLSEKIAAQAVSLLRTERLEMFGNILRSALTPTDILHAAGKISIWNSEAAKLAVSLYAKRAGCDIEAFIQECLREFYRDLLLHLFQIWLKEDGKFYREEDFSKDLVSHLFSAKKSFNLSADIDSPIVFIGAPAGVFAYSLKQFIDSETIVPEHYAVTNAIGSITGYVRENVTILIRPNIEGGFVAYTPGEMKYYETLVQAKEDMMKLAKEIAISKAKRAGASHINVDVSIQDKEINVSDDDSIYLETIVTAEVDSSPVLRRQSR